METGLVVWVQKWEESERGWGTRPDGYTLHLERAHIKEFLRLMRAREDELYKGAVPDEYSRPCGVPYRARVEDSAVVEKLLASPFFGIWGHGADPAPLVAGEDQTGWCTPNEN